MKLIRFIAVFLLATLLQVVSMGYHFYTDNATDIQQTPELPLSRPELLPEQESEMPQTSSEKLFEAIDMDWIVTAANKVLLIVVLGFVFGLLYTRHRAGVVQTFYSVISTAFLLVLATILIGFILLIRADMIDFQINWNEVKQAGITVGRTVRQVGFVNCASLCLGFRAGV